MADEPIESLGGKTPLQVANTPAMDWLAAHGKQGLLSTVPDGFAPGSEIANMSVLGYNVAEVFEGRGSLEAASMGIHIGDNEMAMRCNLICIADGRIKNHSAGHISTEEASELIAFIQQKLGGDDVNFFPGISYRHLLKIKGADKRITCTPPHDVPGTDFRSVLVTADVPEAEATASRINDLILKSQKLLATHPVNQRRIAEGKDPANSIWPWSPGYRPSMRPMSELFSIRNGIVISAVDLIRGIGIYAGLRPVIVDGATGLYNTNYSGKAQAAIDALRGDCDFVFLHVEASDEAGHEGDVALKIRTIENLDSRIISPILDAVKQMDEPVAIAVLPDHPTPCRLRTHSRKPVPFVIYNPLGSTDGLTAYDEFTAKRGAYGMLPDGITFIREFLNINLNKL